MWVCETVNTSVSAWGKIYIQCCPLWRKSASLPFYSSPQFHSFYPLLYNSIFIIHFLSQWTFPHLKIHFSTSMSSTFERFHPHDPLSLSIHLSVYSFQLISPPHTIPSPPFHTCCPFLELFWFGPILLVELCLKYWTQKHLKYELKHLRFTNVECSKRNYTKWKKKKVRKCTGEAEEEGEEEFEYGYEYTSHFPVQSNVLQLTFSSPSPLPTRDFSRLASHHPWSRCNHR